MVNFFMSNVLQRRISRIAGKSRLMTVSGRTGRFRIRYSFVSDVIRICTVGEGILNLSIIQLASAKGVRAA